METPFGEIPDRYLPAMSMADRYEYLQGRMSRRRFVASLAGAGALLAAGPVLWKRPGYAATAPLSRHLTFGSDPAREMSVSWSTAEPVQNPTLALGLDTSYGRTVAAETRAVAGTATQYHHAWLTGLRPGTTYHYKVSHDGGASDDGTFRTAPGGAAPFSFTAFGDQGVSEGAQSITARIATLAPAFHIHAGDICYANNRGLGQPAELNMPDNNVWDVWLSQMTAVAAGAPWMTAVGNHEMEGGYGPQGYDGYLARFALPGGGPAGAPSVYAFRYGNVAVLSLDANDVSYEISANTGYSGGAQDAWLRSTLSGLRADPAIDFIVAQFHHCAYCTNAVHASDGGVRDHWQDLFDEFAVDLVVNGHNHSYERTHPVKGGAVTVDVPTGGVVKPAEQGTTYITAGGGGQVAYQASPYPLSYVTITGGLRVPEAAPWSSVRYLDLSFITVAVAPPGADGRTTMTIRAMKPDGAVVDSVTMERTRLGSGAAPQPAAAGAGVAGAGQERGGRLAATGGTPLAAAGVAAAVGAAALRAATTRGQRKTDDR
jgi:hypothetical protein